MKFLGWMHRKFQHKINEPFKDFSIGNCGCLTGQTFLDEQQYPPWSNHCNKSHHIKEYKENYNFKNQNLLENYHQDDHHVRSDDDDYEEEDEELSDEIFDGFLSIGTLGTNPTVYDDPSTTPTFFISMDNIMEEKETQVIITEDDVKLINDELEKVLGKDENRNLSSGGRNSHVSTGRSSHCSTITLNSKPRESTDDQNSSIISCPLQTYLLGSSSSMGYQETTSTTIINSSSGGNNKEHRVSVSLGELFQKKKVSEEENDHEELKNETKTSLEEKKEKADKSKSSGAFNLKKILKRKKNCGSSSSTSSNDAYGGGGGTCDSVSYEKKLQKILQIFHRKIHPENTTAANKKKTFKNKKLGLKKAGGNDNGQQAHHDEKIPQHKSPSNTAQIDVNGSSSSSIGIGIGPGGPYWIKSDSDFLVLEL